MTITHINPLSTGKILGILYAIMGLIFGGLMSLLSIAGVMANRGGGAEALILGVGAVIFLPLFYGLIGFVGGAFMSLMYNLAASLMGGIEIEVDFGYSQDGPDRDNLVFINE